MASKATGYTHERFIADLLAYSTVSVLIGFASAKLRLALSTTPANIHYDAILDMFLIMPALIAFMAFRFRLVVLKIAIPRIAVLLAAIWLSHTFGFSFGFGRVWDDVVGLAIAQFVIYLLATAIALSISRLIWPLKIRSTRCLQCDYSLIGLTKPVCPECGRTFTLAEQGITEADLDVKQSSDA